VKNPSINTLLKEHVKTICCNLFPMIEYAFYYMNIIVLFSWLLFSAVWIWYGRKDANDESKEWFLHVHVRYVVLILVLIQFLDHSVGVRIIINNSNARMAVLIVVLSGIAFAITARVYIRNDWTSNPAPKTPNRHTLVTSGPYRFVRHPIYGGILFGLLSSAILYGYVWLITFLFYVYVYHYKMGIEEECMLKLHGDEYLAYMKATKRLIPFIY